MLWYAIKMPLSKGSGAINTTAKHSDISPLLFHPSFESGNTTPEPCCTTVMIYSLHFPLFYCPAATYIAAKARFFTVNILYYIASQSVCHATCGHVNKVLDTSFKKVWGLIPTVYKCQANFSVPCCLGPPSCSGYLVDRSEAGSIIACCCRRPLPGNKVTN